VLDRFTWRVTAEGTVDNWRALLEERARAGVIDMPAAAAGTR
jgi:hypothetical protein